MIIEEHNEWNTIFDAIEQQKYPLYGSLPWDYAEPVIVTKLPLPRATRLFERHNLDQDLMLLPIFSVPVIDGLGRDASPTPILVTFHMRHTHLPHVPLITTENVPFASQFTRAYEGSIYIDHDTRSNDSFRIYNQDMPAFNDRWQRSEDLERPTEMVCDDLDANSNPFFSTPNESPNFTRWLEILRDIINESPITYGMIPEELGGIFTDLPIPSAQAAEYFRTARDNPDLDLEPFTSCLEPLDETLDDYNSLSNRPPSPGKLPFTESTDSKEQDDDTDKLLADIEDLISE